MQFLYCSNVCVHACIITLLLLLLLCVLVELLVPSPPTVVAQSPDIATSPIVPLEDIANTAGRLYYSTLSMQYIYL